MTLRNELASEARTWFRFALAGAVIGAVVLGGIGFWYFGWIGLWGGALAGGVIGSICLWWMYLQGSSLT